MTIKRRLLFSNILMIAVPVFVSALVGLACIQAVRFSIEHGVRPGLHTTEDFPEASRKLELAVEHVLQEPPAAWQKKFRQMNIILLEDTISYRVYSGGTVVAQAGTVPADIQKLSAAASLIGGGLVSDGNTSLYTRTVTNENGTYQVELYGIEGKTSYHALKMLLILCATVLAVTVIISVWLTDRFLITFIFRRIEEPLDVLSAGVNELRGGNLSYRIVYDRNDEFTPVCAGFNDMADHLKESIESVRQHEANRTELIAGISHDLRTPITAIQAYIEGLLDGIADTPDMQKKYLTTIRQKAGELEHLISQLFLFSKMELADFPVHAAECSLAPAVHDILQSCLDEYGEDKCVITEQLEPLTVYADLDLLMRICRNCIGNSVKYRTAPAAHITAVLAADSGRAVLTLSDDGPGVPDEMLARLGTLFFRADQARHNTAEGSGLGLAIAAKAAERMGGTLTVRNNPAGGLSVILALPLSAEGDVE